MNEEEIVDNYEKTPYDSLMQSFVREIEEVIQKIFFCFFHYRSVILTITRKRKLLVAIYKDVSVIRMLVRSL